MILEVILWMYLEGPNARNNIVHSNSEIRSMVLEFPIGDDKWGNIGKKAYVS